MRERGGPEEESERLAPVTPLFGGRRAEGAPEAGSTPAHDGARGDEAAEEVVPRRTGETGLWRSTWDGDEHAGPALRAAEAAGLTPREDPSSRHPAHGDRAAREKPRLRALRPHETEPMPEDDGEPDAEQARATAQEVLVRKLRSKALSVSEARQVLRLQDIDSGQAEAIIDEFCERGYLDDATLAWHLVTSGVERKGQGRVALMRALAQRGIPRDVIDDALSELPDDDAERALEFARSKARSMSGLDSDTALRRLVGQLSRRGYNGSVAMTAAKTALAEESLGSPRSGVRFVDSD